MTSKLCAQLENYGDCCCCPNPDCRAWVYRNTLRGDRCIKCNVKPKPQTQLELAIERLAEKLEGL